jgi:hypothetical protein
MGLVGLVGLVGLRGSISSEGCRVKRAIIALLWSIARVSLQCYKLLQECYSVLTCSNSARANS